MAERMLNQTQLYRDAEAAGSNPLTPTNFLPHNWPIYSDSRLVHA